MASAKRKVDDDGLATPPTSGTSTEQAEDRPPKQAKLEGSSDGAEAGSENTGSENTGLGLEDLAVDSLVNIFSHLSLSECLRMERMHSKFADAVCVDLRHRFKVNLTEGRWSMEVPKLLTDEKFVRLMARCENVQVLEGVHPKDTRPPKENEVKLSADGVIEGLKQCSKLKAIGTSSIPVFNFLVKDRPDVHILGQFANRHSTFPPVPDRKVVIAPNLRVVSLNLSAVHVSQLPEMPILAELVLKWVVFDEPQPFEKLEFLHLQRFSMKHCLCEGDPQLVYEQLFRALGHAHRLTHLELVRLPFPPDCLHETAISVSQPEMHSFRFISNLTMAMCSSASEVDLGFLIALSAASIQNLHIQPSLCSDFMFAGLASANTRFRRIEFLQLGYIDDFPACNEMDEDDMEKYGLIPCRETDCTVTDSGMQQVFLVFPELKRLLAHNCPYACHPDMWYTEGTQACQNLVELKLINCSQMSTVSLSKLITKLPCMESLILENVGSPVADMVDAELDGSAVPSTATHAVVQALGMLGIANQAITAMYAKDRVSHFTITSRTVRNVMITKCKYMAIMLKDCPELEDFSLTECENLVSLVFQDSKVSRSRISKCTSLRPEGFLHSLSSLPPTSSHLLVYHAKDVCVNHDDIELTLFSTASSYHVGVIYDQVCPLSVRTQVRMRGWIDWIERINRKLITEGFPQAKIEPYDYNTPAIVRAGEAPPTTPVQEPTDKQKDEDKTAESVPTVTASKQKEDESSASGTKETGKKTKKKGATGGKGKGKKKLKKKMRGPPSQIETEWRCGREVQRYEGQCMAEGTMGDFVYVGDLPWMEELSCTKLMKNWKEAGMFAPTVPAIPIFKPTVTVEQCIETVKESVEARKAAGSGVHEKCLILIVSTAEEKEHKK